MEALAPYLFMLVIVVPGLILVAQISRGMSYRRAESERERVRRLRDENLRRAEARRRQLRDDADAALDAEATKRDAS